ncbi:hypothetical protein [Streptomyces sp. NPDC095817]|uniref:hypothetical protein n=1 Tax=unclassified Streptomyces TaxID=2593676 RepID=UPI003333EB64
MRRPGHFRELDVGIPHERKDLAAVLRSLMTVIGLSLRQTHAALERVDRGCDASSSTLSDLLNAHIQRPRQEVIRAIYDLALNTARKNGVSMPVTWDELEELRLKACEAPALLCATCQATVVPVPSERGDRQHEQGAWPMVLTLLEMKQSRSAEDVAGVLRHVGTAGDPAEVVHAVVGCRASGLCSEADMILQYAQNGRDVQQLAAIAYEFMLTGDNVMARHVLKMSLAQ